LSKNGRAGLKPWFLPQLMPLPVKSLLRCDFRQSLYRKSHRVHGSEQREDGGEKQGRSFLKPI
jgi:hypothetical protein